MPIGATGQTLPFSPMNLLKPLRVLNPFQALQPGYTSPQPLPGESPFEYQHRMSVLQNAGSLERGVNAVGNEVQQAGSYLFGSEQQEQQKRATAAKPKPTASSVFPTSFTDPKWDELEARYGDLAPLLKAVRTQGERTNHGPMGDPRYQNPRTGAYTPYQITSSTRDLFRKRGQGSFDPWSSPENAVAAAAQVLRDHGGAQNPRAAVAGYFGGARAAANPNASFGDGNLSVAQYVDRVLYGGGGERGALRNPFDAGYFQQANAQLDNARNAALTPTQTVFQGEPMPELPQPTPIPKTDFSTADASLEQLRPVEFSEAEAKNLHWKNFWSGLGRAMASSPEGEGLGSLFLRMGGGALMAKGATRDEIQQRKDAYDLKLAKFNAAVYEHNMAKAQVVHNELVADWTANQNWIQNKYQAALSQWQSNNQTQLVGGQLVNQRTDPKTGTKTVTTTPVASLILAEDARDRASLSMQAFGVENSANAQVAGIGNRIQGQIIMGQAAQAMADPNGTAAEQAAAAAYGIMPTVKYAVDTGQLTSIIGEDEMEKLNDDVITTLSGAGFMPGSKEYQSAYREAVMGRVIAITQQSPQIFQRMMDTFGSAASLYNNFNRSIQTTERTQVKSGNRTITRTTTEEPIE